MTTTLDITNIPAPRVPFVDERTGLISREWYRFLLNLFRLTGSGQNDTTLTEVQYLPVFDPAPAEVQFIPNIDPANTQNPEPASLFEVPQPVIGVDPPIDPFAGITVEGLAALLAATEAMAIAPANTPGGITYVVTNTTLVGLGTTASPLGVASKPPVTITADYLVLDTDRWIINNKAATACILTLPAPATWPGRSITVKNYVAFLVTSASSNVVPSGGGAAGTAILLGVTGNWATLVSDATNWVIMQQAPDNILLLE